MLPEPPSNRSAIRRSRAWIVALTAGLAAAGWVGVAVASPTTITRSQAAAVAAAVSLRHSDLPALKQESNPITPQDKRNSEQLNACLGEVPLSEAFALAQSPLFVGAGTTYAQVSSSVSILPSAALVAKDSRAVAGPRALPCLQSSLTSALRRSLGSSASVTIHGVRMSWTDPGANVAFAFHFTIAVRVKQGTVEVSVPMTLDDIGFTYGQLGIDLSDLEVRGTPSSALEHQLVGVLVARAQAADR
ncbi:MAG: hypothetical protein ABSG64_10630 [Solirubrobacteraceae bacterium]